MFKKRWLISCCCVVLTPFTNVEASAVENNGWYSGIKGRIWDHYTELDGMHHVNLGAALTRGYRLDKWRIEGELEYYRERGEYQYSYRHGSAPWVHMTKPYNIDHLNLSANVYRDFDVGSDFIKPYLGLGLGLATAYFRNEHTRNITARTFAQATAGVKVAMHKNIDLDFSYRNQITDGAGIDQRFGVGININFD